LKFDFVGEWSDGLLRVNIGGFHGVGGKWGFVSAKDGGRLVISPRFDGAHDFSEGYAAVRAGGEVKGLWGFINKNGRLVCDYQFCRVGRVSNNLVRVQVGGALPGKLIGKWGYVSATDWSFVLNPVYDEASDFGEEGIAWVRIGPKSGWINSQGHFVWSNEED
jgi:hypothetical protein